MQMNEFNIGMLCNLPTVNDFILHIIRDMKNINYIFRYLSVRTHIHKIGISNYFRSIRYPNIKINKNHFYLDFNEIRCQNAKVCSKKI